MVEGSWWTAWASGGKDASGKHRTEVTEVTEGIEVDGGRFLVDSLGFWAGKDASGKASHRGHGGHRGGLRLDGGRFFGGQLGLLGGKRRFWEESIGTEVTEVMEGD